MGPIHHGVLNWVAIIPSLFGARWIMLCVVGLGVVFWLVFAFRLRQLTGRLRARMAKRLGEQETVTREMQDTLLQSVEGLILRFQTAADRIPQDDPARRTLEEALRESDEVLEQLRERTLGSSGSADCNELPQAFAALCLELKREHPTDFSVVVNGDPRELQAMVRDEVYRIGREAITNSFHHANAAKCETEINYDFTQLHISFRDDGCGVDKRVLQARHQPGNWGLPGMYERALKIGAHLEVWSRPGVGTEVKLRVPATVAYRDSEHASRWQWLRRLASPGR